MPKLDLETIPQTNATKYPAEFAAEVQGRKYRRLAPVAGLTDFGASHVMLEPGAWSAHRHWHEGEDELVIMLSGEATLVEESGRTPMRAGEVAAFRKGDANGHCLVNESGAPCVYVAIGKAPETPCHYPDVDMHIGPDLTFRRKDGTAF